MRAVLREPLLHFLLLGAGLFFLASQLDRNTPDSDPRTIVVDRDSLLTWLQYRSQAFDRARFEQLLDSLPQTDLQQIIRDYVREEALYREAKALELDRNDYVSRRRLIQQMEFITRGFLEGHVDLAEQQIQSHYEAHKAEYYVPPRVTFAHVFFSRKLHGAQQAEALARRELRTLNEKRVRFDQAPAHGDRFLYHVNYVGCEPDEVASQFGKDLQQKLFALEPSDRLWRGPFESEYGFHLVLLTRNEPGHQPSLEDVRARVEQEVRVSALDARFEQSIESIVKAYEVKVEPIRTGSAPADKGTS